MKTKTYREPLGRFVVEYHEELPEEHKAAHRIKGIDPDELWTLQWSHEDRSGAEDIKADEEAMHASICEQLGHEVRTTWRIRDRGEDAPRFIEREAWI